MLMVKCWMQPEKPSSALMNDSLQSPEEVAQDIIKHAFMFPEKHHQLQYLAVEIANALLLP